MVALGSEAGEVALQLGDAVLARAFRVRARANPARRAQGPANVFARTEPGAVRSPVAADCITHRILR